MNPLETIGPKEIIPAGMTTYRIPKVYEYKIAQLRIEFRQEREIDLEAINRLCSDGWEPWEIIKLKNGGHEVAVYTMRREKK